MHFEKSTPFIDTAADETNEIYSSSFVAGNDCRMFAQIQADSEIRGTLFEGNQTRIVLDCIKGLLRNISRQPLNTYITNEDYNNSCKDIIPGLVLKLLPDIIPDINQLINEILLSLQQDGIACVPYAVNKHQCVLEFIYEKPANFLNINIYNTGAGSNHHHQFIDQGKLKHRICKQHKINLSKVAAEEIPQHLIGILNIALPDPATYFSHMDLSQLYGYFEQILSIYPGSFVHHNDSSLITGQRSGTCVWKVFFNYVREKFKQYSDNVLFYQLLKYDIKLRSLIDFKNILEQQFEDIDITQDLIRVVKFTCQNVARLARKEFESEHITYNNFNAALQLVASIEKLVPKLGSAITLEYNPTIRSYTEFEANNILQTKPIFHEPLKQESSQHIKTTFTAEFLIQDVRSCHLAIHYLETAIKKPDSNITGADIEDLSKSCQKYLDSFTTNSLTDLDQLLNSLLTISSKYAQLMMAKHVNGIGFSETKSLTLIIFQMVALRASQSYYNALRVANPDNGADLSNIYRAFFIGIENVLKHRIIIDPELYKTFNLAATQIEELRRAYQVDYNNEPIPCHITEHINLFKHMLPQLWNLLLICARTNMTKSMNILDLKNQQPLLLTALKCSDGNKFWSPHSVSALIGMLKADPKLRLLVNILEIENRPESGKKPEFDAQWPTPFDRYFLPDTSKIYSRGLREIYKLYPGIYSNAVQIDNSNTAFMPLGNQVTAEGSINNKLQSMFAEHGVSLLRLVNFIQQNYHDFNNDLYSDLVFIRLFTNGAIEKQLHLKPLNALKFLELISSDYLIKQDPQDSVSNRSIFMIHTFYTMAWYTLGCVEQCSDLSIREQIKTHIQKTDFIAMINAKIGKITNTSSPDISVINRLLMLKALHYRIQKKLTNVLSEEQIIDLLFCYIRLGVNASEDDYLQNLNAGLLSSVLNDLSPHFMTKNLARIVQFIAENFGYEGAELSGLDYLKISHKISFKINGHLLQWYLLSGVAVFDKHQLVPVPALFQNDPLFMDTFKVKPKSCYALNPDCIILPYRSKTFSVFFDASRNIYINYGEMQLYNAFTNVNYFIAHGFPLTILDCTTEVYFDKYNENVLILDKESKETLYKATRPNFSLDYLITRYDEATLIQNHHDDSIYNAFCKFEHDRFIEVWELSNGSRELRLQRYNITITYNIHDNRLKFINPFSGEYTLIEKHTLSKKLPHAIFFNSANKQFCLLPCQYFIPHYQEMFMDKSSSSVAFDTYGVIFLDKQAQEVLPKISTNCWSFEEQHYLRNYARPQLFKHNNSQKFIRLNIEQDKVECKIANDCFYLAYYLLGGRFDMQLAQEFLWLGMKLVNRITKTPTWLVAILKHLPCKLHSNFSTHYIAQERSEYYGTIECALRMQAWLFIYELQLFTKMHEKIDWCSIGTEATELLADLYFENVNNIPAQYRLSNAEELRILSSYEIPSKWGEHNFFSHKLKQLKRLNYDAVSISFETKMQSINCVFEFKDFIGPALIFSPLRIERFSLGRFISLLTQISPQSDNLHDLQEFINLYLFLAHAAKNSFNRLRLQGCLHQYIIKLGDSKDKYAFALLYLIKQHDLDATFGAKMLQHYKSFVEDRKITPTYAALLEPFIPKNQTINFTVNADSITEVATKQSKAFNVQAALTQELAINLNNVNEIKTAPAMAKPVLNIDGHKINRLWLQAHSPAVEQYIAPHFDDYLAGIRRNLSSKSIGNFEYKLNPANLADIYAQSLALKAEIVTKFNVTPSILDLSLRCSMDRPALDFQAILHLFIQQDLQLFKQQSFMSEAQILEVNSLIFDYLYKMTEFQFQQRGILDQKRAYTADDPVRLVAICLLFEYSSNIRLYPSQFENIKLMLKEGNQIIQMAMGQGKTQVMSPIIAIANADGKNLSIYMAPETLFNTTVANFSNIVYETFGFLPYPITYERKALKTKNIVDILNTVKAAIMSRNFIIITPATLHALHLSRIECALTDCSAQDDDGEDEVKPGYLKQAFAELFTIFRQNGICTIDEIDQTLDLELEYNFASVNYKHLSKKFPNLINSVLDLYRVLRYVTLPYANNSVLDIIFGMTRKPLPHEWPVILPLIAEAVYTKLQLDFLPLDKQELLSVLLGRKSLDSLASQLSIATKDLLAIFKHELTDLLQITVNSSFLEEFGPQKLNAVTFIDLLAMPYRKLVPLTGSEFSDPLTTINYTIQAFLRLNVQINENLIRLLFSDLINKFNKLTTAQERSNLLDFIKKLLGVNEASTFNLDQLTADAFINFTVLNSGNNQTLKFYMLQDYILPHMIESDYEMQSRAFTINRIFKKVSGFSGTIENSAIFKPDMCFANREQSLGTDGAVIDTLVTRDTTVGMACYTTSPQQQLQDLIFENAVANRNLHALIDLGAVFKDIGSNAAVAACLALHFRLHSCFAHIKYILYFSNNLLVAHNIYADSIIEIANTSNTAIFEALNINSMDACFTFYDQAHTTGVDIKQAETAHTILTIGEITKKTDLLQAVMRMRGFTIDGKQTIEMFVGLLAREKRPELQIWNLTEVLRFALDNTLMHMLDMNYRAAQLLMQECVLERIESIALDPNVEGSQYSDILAATVSDSLYARYGRLATLTEVRHALLMHRNIYLQIAASYIKPNEVQELSDECDNIIKVYIPKCAVYIQTTLSAAQVKSYNIVTRSTLAEESVEQMEQQFSSIAALTPKLRKDLAKSWEGFCNSYKQDDLLSKLSLAEDSLSWPQVFYASSNFHEYYKANNATQQLMTGSKNSYYVAVTYNQGTVTNIEYILLDEEAKDSCIQGLSGYRSAPKWQLATTDVQVFNIDGCLEYSTNCHLPDTIDPKVLLLVHFYNADVMSLLDMIKGNNSDLVFDFFAAKETEKREYLNSKVRNFCCYQKPQLKEFLQRLAQGRSALNGSLPLLHSFQDYRKILGLEQPDHSNHLKSAISLNMVPGSP